MWHHASCFDDIATILQERGYFFISQDAPGIAPVDASEMTVELDSRSLRDNILIPLVSQGKDIILLMHSYGGIYGSDAVRGLSKTERILNKQEGGVAGLIYVSAVTPSVGRSLMDMLGLTLQTLPPHVIYEVHLPSVQFTKPFY